MLKKISLVTLLIMGSLSASDTLKPILQMGYDWGGTTLRVIEHDNLYYGREINKIRAGEGLSFEAGAALSNDDSNMELQFLIGYKFDSDSAGNGDVTWDVIPFTALAMFKSDRWKIGGGITYHLNPKLSGSFDGYDNNNNYFNDRVDNEYDNAIGGVAQIQYRATNAFSVGVKATFIEYDLIKSLPGVEEAKTVDGDSIGIVFNYTFGNERSEFR